MRSSVSGADVRKRLGGRREVVRAVEARIRVQVEPLEIPIEVGLNVPHLVLRQPVVARKALRTSIALEWLSIAQSTKMKCQIRLVTERFSTVFAPMSNQQMHSIDVTLKITFRLI